MINKNKIINATFFAKRNKNEIIKNKVQNNQINKIKNDIAIRYEIKKDDKAIKNFWRIFC